MAALTFDKAYKTVSVSTSGDTLVTRTKYVRLKNLGANVVSFSESANPTGAFTAGDQSSVNPAAAGGEFSSAVLRPSTTYYLRAATGATLCALEEIETPSRAYA